MSYKVIHFFTDLQDSNYPYKVGDKFPRLGLKVSEARLKELSSSKNRQGKPLIEYISDKKVEEKVEPVKEEKDNGYTKTEINRMSASDLRTLASAQGIENVEDYTGGELKKMLIEKLGL